MLKLDLTLDGKIASVNTIYRRGKYGGVFLAPEVVQYRKDMKPVIQEAYEACGTNYDGGLLNVDVTVHTSFYTKGNEVRVLDIDNFAKQVLDTIFPALGINDKMVFNLSLHKDDYHGQPYITVRIEEYPDPVTQAIKSKQKVGKKL